MQNKHNNFFHSCPDNGILLSVLKGLNPDMYESEESKNVEKIS
jgi:hypothetical protein